MILDLIPMPDEFSTEWMAQLGYESAERAKRKKGDRLLRKPRGQQNR